MDGDDDDDDNKHGSLCNHRLRFVPVPLEVSLSLPQILHVFPGLFSHLRLFNLKIICSSSSLH